jgi:hypothetical protein
MNADGRGLIPIDPRLFAFAIAQLGSFDERAHGWGTEVGRQMFWGLGLRR